MSNTYPGVIQGLNPIYYWRLHQFLNPYILPAYNFFYTWLPEERRKDTNFESSGSSTDKSAGWYLSAGMPADTPTPGANSGPIAGGDSRGIMVYDTVDNPGPRLLKTGSYATLEHEIPMGRNEDSTINMWFKTIPPMPAEATTTQHIMTSSRNSNHEQHFMIAERQKVVDGVDSNELKIKTKALDTTQYYEWSSTTVGYNHFKTTEWNMLTYTSAEVPEDGTTLDGQKIYMNGKFVFSIDSVWEEMLDSPGVNTSYMYLMCGYSTATSVKPGACAEVSIFDKVLNASQIEEIYHHATSPSPARIRGGLHRQLGRLV